MSLAIPWLAVLWAYGVYFAKDRCKWDLWRAVLWPFELVRELLLDLNDRGDQ